MDNVNNEGDSIVTIKENQNEQYSNNYDNNNYLKDIFLKNKYLNILILVLSLAAFISEFIYRDYLYRASLDFEERLQRNSWNITITYYKIITKVGGEYFMALPVGFTFCFYSLIKSSVYICGFFFCLQFHSMMKIWYGNTRPFWDKPKLYQDICDGGFGNPSGHSMVTTYLYLTLFIYLNELQYFKNNKKAQIIALAIILFWIFSIIYSRIFLGVHSINQIIFGTTLGLIVFCFEIIVFKLNQMPISFYKKLFKEKKYIINISSVLLFISLLTILNKFIFKDDNKKDTYDGVINNKCGDNYPKYRRFNNDGLFGSFIIFSLMGMYFGQIYFWYLIDNKYKKDNNIIENNILNKSLISLDLSLSEENESINNQNEENEEKKEILEKNEQLDELINNWNQNRILMFGSLTNILKIILVIIICASPTLLFIIIPKGVNLFCIFVFKVGIPFFSSLFLLYSYGFYYIIKFSCGHKEILIQRLNQTETEEKIINFSE